MPQKRIRDKDIKENVIVQISRSATTTDTKVVGTASNKDEIMVSHCKMQILQ